MQSQPEKFVSLPMYLQRPETLAAFWQGLHRHLEKTGLARLPPSLTTPPDYFAHWTSPALLMSQTCGYPLTDALRGRVRYVGTPCYAAPGCEGATYRSLIIVRADEPARSLGDLRGGRAAYNSEDSQSGYNVFRSTIAPLAQEGRFFRSVLATGSHVRSAQAVASGDADVACVDCISFALLGEANPSAVAGLRVLEQTVAVPGLPIITALGTSDEDLERLRAGWRAALADPTLGEPRAALMLAAFEVLDLADYEVIPRLQRDAEAQGYPHLG